jgi:uncharacterized membrane protein
MSAATLILIARVLHILGGAIWAGFVIVYGFILMNVPSSIGASEARRARKDIIDRGGAVVAPAAIITVLSGGYLYVMLHAGAHSRTETILQTGAASAILALVIGAIGIGVPYARLAKLDANGAPPASSASLIASLNRRAILSGRVAAALLVLTVVAMSAANWV